MKTLEMSHQELQSRMTNLTTAQEIYKVAIPIGAKVNLNTYNNTLTVLEPTVNT